MMEEKCQKQISRKSSYFYFLGMTIYFWFPFLDRPLHRNINHMWKKNNKWNIITSFHLF